MIERMHKDERRFPFQFKEVQVDKSGNLLPDGDQDGLPDFSIISFDITSFICKM